MSLIGAKTIKSISSISSSDTKQTNMTNYEKSKIHKTASFHGGVEIIDWKVINYIINQIW